jgi:hypothetical protein
VNESLIAKIREHIRQHGGWSAIEKYGRENVDAAMIPED